MQLVTLHPQSGSRRELVLRALHHSQPRPTGEPPTLRMGLPISFNKVEKRLRFVSEVILDPIKLTIKINHHTGVSETPSMQPAI